jgi:hypothetical protein
MNANILRWVGIVDGVLLAAVTTLGQQVPTLQPDTNVAVQVLGTITTILAGYAHVSYTRALKAAKSETTKS